jgi:hypothetical protein
LTESCQLQCELTPVLLAAPEDTLQIARQQRLAIEGLLNDGTNSFVKGFEFPSFEPQSSRSHSPTQEADSREGQIDPAGSDGFLGAVTPRNDPFAIPWIDPYTEMVFGFDETYSDFHDNIEPSPEFLTRTEHDVRGEADQRVQSVIEDKIRELGLDEHFNMSSLSELLFSGKSIAAHIARYFDKWQQACPIIHEASFDRDKVPLRLLVVMTLIGAMYSKDRERKCAGRQLLDIAELVVFDAEIFSSAAEIGRQIRMDQETAASHKREYTWDEFQELQAAYLMVEAQYWAGSRTSKGRAVDLRVGSLVSVCCFSPLRRRTQT